MINERLARVQKTFIVSIIGLVFAVMLTLAGSLVVVDVLRYNHQVSADNISSLTQNYPDVAAYLQSQKAASPHFVTIANLVKQDQQEALARAFAVVAAPIIIASLILGYVIANRLLRPVADSYEARDRFIQDAAHELRNPLAAMSATIETVQANPKHDPQIQKAMQRLQRQTERLIQINEDLLFLQRAAEPFKGRTNISSLTKKVVKDFTPTATDKQITLVSKIGSNIKASIRPRDYEILIRNLVDNAIKYSPMSSKVTITLATEGKQLVLTVADQGIGIPELETSKITGRFYRASNTTGVSGSGLGLALVDKVLITYHGDLEVQSTPKKGSTFVATLPT